MDPVRNPYAPGASTQPPAAELAGRRHGEYPIQLSAEFGHAVRMTRSISGELRVPGRKLSVCRFEG